MTRSHHYTINEYKESVERQTGSIYHQGMGKPITHRHILEKFGNKMQEVRKSKGVTQEELAARLSMHRTYIGLVERGERNPTIRTLYKIVKALDIKASDILPF